MPPHPGEMTSTMLPSSSTPVRTSPRIYLVAGLTVLALFLAAPVIFFMAYAFNDSPDGSDHLFFLTRTLGVVAAVALLSGACIALSEPRTRWQAFAGAAAVASSVYAGAGAGYAFLSMFPALDPAIGSSASIVTCAAYAVGLSVTATATGSQGRRWLTEH